MCKRLNKFRCANGLLNVGIPLACMMTVSDAWGPVSNHGAATARAGVHRPAFERRRRRRRQYFYGSCTDNQHSVPLWESPASALHMLTYPVTHSIGSQPQPERDAVSVSYVRHVLCTATAVQCRVAQLIYDWLPNTRIDSSVAMRIAEMNFTALCDFSSSSVWRPAVISKSISRAGNLERSNFNRKSGRVLNVALLSAILRKQGMNSKHLILKLLQNIINCKRM